MSLEYVFIFDFAVCCARFLRKIISEEYNILSQDGFVLVGSVAGQRYWSSMLNDKATITCGIWTPDDQQVCKSHFMIFYRLFGLPEEALTKVEGNQYPLHLPHFNISADDN